MKTNLQILKEAKSLIKNPDNYSIGSFARTEYGISTNIHDENACQFCSRGAIIRASGETDLDIDKGGINSSYRHIRAEAILHKAALEIMKEEYSDVFDYKLYNIDCVPAASINNLIGHKGAMKVFNRAIEIAEKET